MGRRGQILPTERGVRRSSRLAEKTRVREQRIEDLKKFLGYSEVPYSYYGSDDGAKAYKGEKEKDRLKVFQQVEEQIQLSSARALYCR